MVSDVIIATGLKWQARTFPPSEILSIGIAQGKMFPATHLRQAIRQFQTCSVCVSSQSIQIEVCCLPRFPRGSQLEMVLFKATCCALPLLVQEFFLYKYPANPLWSTPSTVNMVLKGIPTDMRMWYIGLQKNDAGLWGPSLYGRNFAWGYFVAINLILGFSRLLLHFQLRWYPSRWFTC